MEKKYGWFVLFTLIIMLCVAGCASEEEIKAVHLENAKKYIAENAYQEAVLELKNVIQMDPENDAALLLLGQTYIKLGEVDMAAAAYGNAVDANPDNLQAHFKMGQMYLAARNTMQARKVAKFILEKTPDDIEALHLLVAVQTQEKNLPAAVKTVKRAIVIDSRNIKSRLILAQLTRTMGDMDGAEKVYLEAVSVEPSAPEPYIKLIRLYADAGQWDKSQSILNQLCKECSAPHSELKSLARFCEGHQKWHMAEQIYQYAIEHALANETLPLVNLGIYHARRGSPEKGLVLLQQALEIDKNDPDILTNIARLHMGIGDMDAADAAVKEALQKDANHGEANYVKGTVDFVRKDYANALNRFEHTIKKAPRTPMAYYFKALCLLEKDSESGSGTDLFRAAAGYNDDADAWVEKVAEENLDKAIELNPNLIPARLVLADINLKKQNADKARRQIEGILSLDPNHEKALSLQGSLKILERDFTGAEAVCKKVLKNKPDSSQWYTRLGLVYVLQKRPADAATVCEKALELTPNQFDALQLLIDIKLRMKKHEEAFAACDNHKKKLEKDPTAVAIIENMKGRIYLARGDRQAARECFGRSMAGNPDFLSPRMALARISVAESNYDQAMEEYNGVLAVNENYLPACMALGDLYYKQTNKKEAEKYYRKALKIKSGYAPAANNLAFLLSSYDNKIRQALDFAQLAAQKMPDDPTVKDTLGWIHYRMGNYYKAVSELKRSLAMNPNDALANYHIGMAYYQNKEFDIARTHIEKALRIDSEFDGAKEARAMLDR